MKPLLTCKYKHLTCCDIMKILQSHFNIPIENIVILVDNAVGYYEKTNELSKAFAKNFEDSLKDLRRFVNKIKIFF